MPISTEWFKAPIQSLVQFLTECCTWNRASFRGFATSLAAPKSATLCSGIFLHNDCCKSASWVAEKSFAAGNPTTGVNRKELRKMYSEVAAWTLK